MTTPQVHSTDFGISLPPLRLPTIPATDLGRAARFYTEVMGFADHRSDRADHGLAFSFDKSWFHLYPSPRAGTAEHTAAGFTVDGIDGVVEALRGRGVEFREYEEEWIRTEDGIADLGVARAAWLDDTEGNHIALVEMAD